MSFWIKALGNQVHAFPEHPIFSGPAFTNHGSGDCSGNNHDRTSVKGHQRPSGRFGDEEAKVKQRVARKHGLTLLMEYVVVDERPLPIGATDCATILARQRWTSRYWYTARKLGCLCAFKGR